MFVINYLLFPWNIFCFPFPSSPAEPLVWCIFCLPPSFSKPQWSFFWPQYKNRPMLDSSGFSKLTIIWSDLFKIDQNWFELDQIYKKWSKSSKLDQNVQNWTDLIKIDQKYPNITKITSKIVWIRNLKGRDESWSVVEFIKIFVYKTTVLMPISTWGHEQKIIWCFLRTTYNTHTIDNKTSF